MIFPINKGWFEFVQPTLFQVGGCEGTLPTQQKAKGFEVSAKEDEGEDEEEKEKEKEVMRWNGS